MPVVLNKSGAVFLHIHKTGGTWVREALTKASVAWQDVGYQHWDYAASAGINPGRPRFTIIRYPYDWYASFWAWRHESGWGGDLALGHDCQSVDFSQFVKNCVQRHPAFLRELYSRYTKPGVVVLKTRQLSGSLGNLLHRLGEKFDPVALSGLDKVNQSASLAKYAGKPFYTSETALLLYRSECATLSAYDYERTIPKTTDCICGDTVGTWKEGSGHRHDCPVHQAWRGTMKVDKGARKG